MHTRAPLFACMKTVVSGKTVEYTVDEEERSWREKRSLIFGGFSRLCHPDPSSESVLRSVPLTETVFRVGCHWCEVD